MKVVLLNFTKMSAKLDSKKGDEEELCVFFGEKFSIPKICYSKRNLHTLIVIGQPSITSLDGISELINLRELWVVECQIKDTENLEKCKNIEKLYLYSNRIEKIPNLVNCERLAVLNLAGNFIRKIRNIRGLVFLQELILANNVLKRLLNFFPSRGNLRRVNFAGNPLYVLKDIKSLLGQKKLESAVFADPLYGESPLVRLCHYRYHVINFLSNIKELDHYEVTDEERNTANNFISEKKMFYNVLWHTSLNNFWVTQKDKYKEYYRKVSFFKNKLGVEKFLPMKENQNFKEISEGFLKLKTQYEEIQDWEKKEIEKLQVFQHQLSLKCQYSGNVDFIECEDKIIETCQSMLEDSLCHSIKNLGVRGVTLSRVTKIKNNGVKALQPMKSPREESSDTIFMFLVSTNEVLTMQKWPFLICENSFLNEKEVWVSDCLASADENWLRDFSLENFNRKKYEKSLETRICLLLQCSKSLLKKCKNAGKFKNVHLDDNRNCQEFCIAEVEKVNPVFVIEYNYQFEKEFCENDTEMQFPLVPNRDSITDVNLKLKNNLALQNLMTLNLSHQGLTRIKLTSEFPNLRELNLSCNQLKKFPNAEILKYLRILKLAFNEIISLTLEEKLFQLEKLDISWNNLSEYMPCMEKLKIFAPNLKELSMEYNPFGDIFQTEARATLARIYLPGLKIFDRIKIDEKLANEFISVRKCCSGSINIFDKAMNTSSSICKINENLRTLKAEEDCRRIRRLNLSGNLISNTNFVAEFPALQELSLSNNILVRISIKPLRNLVKLNLSSNFIKSSDNLKREILPVLKFLDLSNNLISSLLAMGDHENLREFYCHQNKFTDLSEILNLRSWSELRVVDLSQNGEFDSLSRTFFVFHLPNIKYANREPVQESDILEAKNEFSGSLNRMTLMTSKSLSDLQNIKELSIVCCSIKKVNLTFDCLPNLESLDLRKNQISFLWGLHLLPKLKTLCLSYNRVEFFDQIDRPKNTSDTVFPNLISLYLDHNRIRSLQLLKLGKCLKLKHLFLQYNHLQDIDGLQESANLETLVLDHNEIKTITPENFRTCNNLRKLFLENNRIKYLCFAKCLPKLKTLLLANNKIADQSQLKELASLCNLTELSLLGNPLCKKTRNHYKFLLQFLENLSIVDRIEILQSEN